MMFCVGSVKFAEVTVHMYAIKWLKRTLDLMLSNMDAEVHFMDVAATVK